MSDVLNHLATDDAGPENGHPGSDMAATDIRIWAARITERWRASVESIFEVGRILIEAKDRMPRGSFGEMCETQLPFSSRTAQRLMAIALDNRLTNPTHVSLLPASWGTLAALTELSDDEFSSAIKQKIISPNMIRADVDQIKALARPQQSQSESNQRQNGYGTEGAHADGVAIRPDAGRSASTTSENLDVTAGETAPLPSGNRASMASRVEPDGSLDLFPTPPFATRALIERVLRHLGREGVCKWQKAWDPACGLGHMSDVLREYFVDVYATDIESRGYEDEVLDFRSCTSANVDWIITNPPFGDLAEQFVLKAIDLAGTGVAMFVQLRWLETIGRYENIFRDRPPSLIAIFAERVPICKDEWDPNISTATAYVWLVWLKSMGPQPPFWIPPGCRVALTKPDDVKRFSKRKSATGEPPVLTPLGNAEGDPDREAGLDGGSPVAEAPEAAA